MIKLKMIDDATIRETIANDMTLIFDSVKDAFMTVSKKQACHPKKTKIFRPGEEVLDDWIFSMPAYIAGTENIAGLKWASRFPGASEGNVHILLILNETITNKPIAIMDGMFISLLRTFAITKLSIDMMKLQPKKVCIIGMGSLGRMHALKLKEIYPSIEKIHCFSFNAKCDDIKDDKIFPCTDLQEALDSANIIVTCGQKRSPYINNKMLPNSLKLIVNLSLCDFDESVFAKAGIVLVDDFDAIMFSNTTLGKSLREEKISKNKTSFIGDYFLGAASLPKSDNFVLVNTLGMVAQDLIIANRVLKRLKDMNLSSFNIL